MSRHYGIIGQSGQVARALAEQLCARGDQVTALSRAACDLSEAPDLIRHSLEAFNHVDAVLLAAAYTAVDLAETETDIANRVNGTAPGVIAAFCAARKIPLVHFSTDYVFFGDADDPYKPDQPTRPLNAYGASKLKGEQAIAATDVTAAILRTSWVFDGTGKNFLTTMLRLSETREALSVVNDQIGRPTFAGHLAQAAIIAADALTDRPTGRTDIYHVSGTGAPISWADFARAIFKICEREVIVTGIPSSDYPTPAARPAFSVMETAGFERLFDVTLPSWQAGLEAAVKDYHAARAAG